MQKFYRQGKDIYNAQTNQRITLPEWQSSWTGRAQEVSPPQQTSQQPPITRDSSGNIQTLVNPLDKWKNHTVFMNTVKDIIRQKQNMNQDLQGAKRYWRTLISDTSPFGGVREPIAQLTGTFTDERMRQLSPVDQASIRASRYSAANAHLKGLAEEQKYRETRMDDIVNTINDAWKERDKLAQNELDRQKQMIDIATKRAELGVPVTAEDLGLDASKGVGNRIGGTISWRHNNPLNIKYSDFAKKYGAKEGQKASDGGSFAVFPTVEAGLKAAKDLLTGSTYSNLTLNQAMKLWSGGVSKTPTAIDKTGFNTSLGKRYFNNNGYGIDGISSDTTYFPNTKVKDLSDEQINDILQGMGKREGWEEGTILGQSTEHVYWTKSAIKSLAQKLGKTSEELGKLSDSQLDKLAYENSNNLVNQAYKKLPKTKLVKYGINEDLAKDLLKAMYEKYSPEEIKSMLQGVGQDPSIYDNFMEIVNNSGNNYAELMAIIASQESNTN